MTDLGRIYDVLVIDSGNAALCAAISAGHCGASVRVVEQAPEILSRRDTAFMNLLLAVYLGVVFALFASMPYGKFVHGFYRYLALVRFAREARTH